MNLIEKLNQLEKQYYLNWAKLEIAIEESTYGRDGWKEFTNQLDWYNKEIWEYYYDGISVIKGIIHYNQLGEGVFHELKPELKIKKQPDISKESMNI